MIELELAARRWQFIKSCTLAFSAADQCSRHFAGEKTLSKFNAKALHNISPCRIFLPHREQRPATESLKIILRNLWLEVISKPDRIICVKCGEKKSWSCYALGTSGVIQCVVKIGRERERDQRFKIFTQHYVVVIVDVINRCLSLFCRKFTRICTSCVIGPLRCEKWGEAKLN